MTNSPSTRIAELTDFLDSVGQLLLDVDPEASFYWELVAQAEAAAKTIDLLRKEEPPTYDPTMDPCSPFFDSDSWNE